MTVVSALPLLLNLSPQAGIHRRVLGCDRHPFGHAPDPKVAKKTPVLDWSVCPIDLLSHPSLQAVFTFDRMATIAPVANWPNGYTAWLVQGLLALRQKRGE